MCALSLLPLFFASSRVLPPTRRGCSKVAAEEAEEEEEEGRPKPRGNELKSAGCVPPPTGDSLSFRWRATHGASESNLGGLDTFDFFFFC